MLKNKYLPSILIILFCLVEFLNNFFSNYFNESQSYRFLFKIVLLGVLIPNYTKNELKIFFLIFILFSVFLLGQFYTIQFEFAYIKNIGLFFNYVYIFLIVVGLKKIINTKNYEITKNVLQLVFAIFLATILIGFIFNINMFSTYYQGERFGFKGLLNKSSDLTYFLCLGIISNEILKFKFQKYFLLAFILAVFVSGTKASLLFLVFYISYLLYQNRSKLNFKNLSIYLLVGSGFIFLIYSLFRNKFQNTFNIFLELYQEEGLISALTSFRSRKLLELGTLYMDKWNFINYMFGGKIDYYLFTEFDFIDIIIFFGFLGGAYYLFLLYHFIFKTAFNDNKVLWILFFIIAGLTGQFFYNTTIAIFVAYIICLVEEKPSQTPTQIKNLS